MAFDVSRMCWHQRKITPQTAREENAVPGGLFDACVFDLFDTLVYFSKEDYLEKVQKAAALCGITENEYLNKWKATGVDSILGRHATTTDRVHCFLKAIGTDANDNLVELLTGIEHQFLRDKTYWYDDAISTLTQLRCLGIKLGLVTNASPSVREVISSRRIHEVIDELIISSEIRTAKPDIGIYIECLRRLGCSSARAAYVGDGNDRELDGAKRVGLFTILIRRNDVRAFVFEQSSEGSTDAIIDTLSLLPSMLGNSEDSQKGRHQET